MLNMGLSRARLGGPVVLGLMACAGIAMGVGCQSDPSATGSTTDITGAGGSTADTTSTTGSVGGGGASSTTGAGGSSPCEGVDSTIEAVTKGEVGPGVKVKLTGVVATSQKFLVSKGSTSGSCLWGVFVSKGGITDAAPNTGMLILDYGFNAEIPEGGTDAFCPVIGKDEVGDDIPDDIAPGDQLDIIGETANFLLGNCATEANGATVGQFQLAKSCMVDKTGTAAVPKAHLFTGAELDQLASPSDKAFHDQWGGVRVRVENVTAKPGTAGAVGDYGIITLEEGNLEVGSKLYYQGYLAGSNFCHDSVVFDTTFDFDYIEGISYLDYCTWRIQPNDKCADFSPSSEDCNGALVCPP